MNEVMSGVEVGLSTLRRQRLGWSERRKEREELQRVG